MRLPTCKQTGNVRCWQDRPSSGVQGQESVRMLFEMSFPRERPQVNPAVPEQGTVDDALPGGTVDIARMVVYPGGVYFYKETCSWLVSARPTRWGLRRQRSETS